MGGDNIERGISGDDKWIRHVRGRLLSWFRENARDFVWRREGFPTYGLLVAEMMLQRTQAKVVEPVLKEFLKRFPTVYDLHRAPLREVRRAIWRLGLHRTRSRNLKRAAKIIVEKYGGDVDAALDELADLPGVGPYIAGAVACCRGRRTPAVDSTAGRVLGRLFGLDHRNPRNLKILWEKAQEVIPEQCAREFNWALLDLAASVCRPSAPRCDVCPLRGLCATFKGQRS